MGDKYIRGFKGGLEWDRGSFFRRRENDQVEPQAARRGGRNLTVKKICFGISGFFVNFAKY